MVGMGLAEDNNGWILWSPAQVEGDEIRPFEEITSSMADFKAAHDPGNRAVQWLQTGALEAWPNVATWLYWDGRTQRIEGFFSVCKTDRLRRDMTLGSRRVKPASEIKWICRHTYASLKEMELVKKAALAAVRLWEPPADVTVLVEPQGADTASIAQLDGFWRLHPSLPDLIWTQFDHRKARTRPKDE